MGDWISPRERETWVVLDELDADRILRRLYNGRRPEKIHILICLCGAMGDLWQSPRAWNGWRVLPNAVCPACLANESLCKLEDVARLYPSLAHKRFRKELAQLRLQKAERAIA